MVTEDELDIPETIVTKKQKKKKKNKELSVNPLLDRARMPGETFRLPSRGIFYTNGELAEDVEEGELHMYAMTAIDEIVLSSPSKLFSGESIIEVIRRCVPDVLIPEELLSQDIDFILLCLRKVSYGPTFDFARTHNDCEIELPEDHPIPSHEYQINMDHLIKQTKEINPENMVANYRIELDSGQVVQIQPIRFGAYVKVMQVLSQKIGDNAEDMSLEDQKDMLLNQLATMISAVDEITDTDMIREWLEVINPAQVRKINTSISNMGTWGVNTVQKIKCRDCKKEMEVEIPTNPLALFS